MKLKFKETPEQVELIKAMGSKKPEVAREASEAFADYISPVIQQVLMQADTASSIYTDVVYDEDDNPSYPLDLFYEQRNSDNYVTVWSQNMAGGLPSSQVSGTQELKISTYRLDSAVSILKKYARKGRLDVVSKLVERMAQEILVKQERNAWAVLLKALAEGKGTAGSAGDHIVDSTGSTGPFTVDSLNRLITKMKRLNKSFAGGTPASTYSEGVTDLFVSPEVKQDIRAMAYQPLNPGASGENIPDDAKSVAWKSAGIPTLFGINIIDLQELGVGQKYNKLFENFEGGSFADASNHEVLIGVDSSKEALIRPVARNADTGSTFTAIPDDQYTQRQDKAGFYGSIEEGRACIDARALAGITVKRS